MCLYHFFVAFPFPAVAFKTAAFFTRAFFLLIRGRRVFPAPGKLTLASATVSRMVRVARGALEIFFVVGALVFLTAAFLGADLAMSLLLNFLA